MTDNKLERLHPTVHYASVDEAQAALTEARRVPAVDFELSELRHRMLRQPRPPFTPNRVIGAPNTTAVAADFLTQCWTRNGQRTLRCRKRAGEMIGRWDKLEDGVWTRASVYEVRRRAYEWAWRAAFYRDDARLVAWQPTPPKVTSLLSATARLLLEEQAGV